MPVVLVAGPPCSGKTTFATTRAARLGGTVLDWDDVWVEVTGLPRYERPAYHPLMAQVGERFRERADTLAAQGGREHVWMIRSAPSERYRALLCREWAASSVVLAVPAEECIRRLEASDRPARTWPDHRLAIERWWTQYEPSTSDSEW